MFLTLSSVLFCQIPLPERYWGAKIYFAKLMHFKVTLFTHFLFKHGRDLFRFFYNEKIAGLALPHVFRNSNDLNSIGALSFFKICSHIFMIMIFEVKVGCRI